jgi:hypothetical protein
MLWTFPPARRETHRLFVRDLDFVDIHEIPKFQADLAACRFGRCPPGKVRELTGFDQRFDGLWERVKAHCEVIAVRDARHLQWRYCRNPAVRYRVLAHFDGDTLNGYAVVKHYEDELQVVDVLTLPDPDIGVRLVGAAAELAAQECARTVGMWLNYSHPLHRRLEALGFRIGAPVTYFCGRVLGSDVPAAFIYDFRKWYVTMGDSDAY